MKRAETHIKERYTGMLLAMIVFGLVLTQCVFFDSTNPIVSTTTNSTAEKVTQPPREPAWMVAIGGGGRDYAPSFCQTDDGYVVVGMSSSYGLGDGGGNQGGSHDFLAIKLDDFGNLVWSTTIGGPEDERGSYSVSQTMDGGFLLVGTTKSFGAGRTDIFLVKLASDGHFEWSLVIGGSGSETGMTALETGDGFMVLGSTDSFGAGKKDLLAVRLTSGGAIIWSKTYGGIADDVGSGIAAVNENFVIGGTIWSFGAGEADAGLIMIDGSGNVIWGKTIGGEAGEGINWDGVRISRDGGIFFGEKTGSFGAKGGGALFGVKLRPNGNLEWSTMIDGPGEDAGWTMNETEDGFIASGKITLQPNGGDILFVKFDKQGKLLWSRIFGAEGLDEIEEIKMSGEGYVMSGVTRMTDPAGDFLIARVNSDGFIGGSSDPITAFEPRSINSVVPKVTPFSPKVSDVSTLISVMEVMPTITHPIVQIHFLSRN